jgi:hypothetical protein
MSDLENSLVSIIEKIKQDSFGGRDAPVVFISDDLEIQAGCIKSGSIIVKIQCKNGEMALLHEQPLEGITNDSELKNAFSEALSKVLASHSEWPR